jgi:DNA adenine methylase
VYAEPFAGGAGVALALLHGEYVDEVVLNDLDAGVAAFWRSVFQQPRELSGLIRSSTPTLAEWHRQNEIYQARPADDLTLGFATFFLNRTNRSGILDARPIGGLEQKGSWGIAARFNAAHLADRIDRLARYASRVTIFEEDGIEVTRQYVGETDVFVYADPPYLSIGSDLYLNDLSWEDHERLATVLCAGERWMLTYDDDPRVPTVLYPRLRCAAFGIAHTASVQHIGREYAVFADSLFVESLDWLGHDAVFLDADERGDFSPERSL